MIMGATGDAGHFSTVAEELADQFTVVTYDRRGNSRSPRPPEWSTTTVEEQADDAAALLRALELAPAAVFGTSNGAIYALGLLIRDPELVTAAVLQDPPMFRVLDQPDPVREALRGLIEEGMAAGGPPVALERFWRLAAGDENWETLDPDLRERMLGNAETYFDIELWASVDYLPEAATLAAIETPTQLLRTTPSPPHIAAIIDGLAQRLGAEVVEIAATHTPYQDRPHELAEAIRSFFGRAGSV
jgi:pimeloyl-ACP methyl ester carboxylesterase